MSVYKEIIDKLKATNTTLVAISKTKPVEQIMELYRQGQRLFGENKVQELVDKYEQCPKDIEWHLVGHLQSNKVKYIAPFVSLIHAIDSLKLLEEVNRQAQKNNRKIKILLQYRIATEDTKFGLSQTDIVELMDFYSQSSSYNFIEIVGLMGMASFTENETQIRTEFSKLKEMFTFIKESYLMPKSYNTMSMGMSGDYKIAIEEGSTMVRIGSLLFGAR